MCTCEPVVLRISLPPGTSPEIVSALVERAVRDYFRRHAPWGDVPEKLTEAEYRTKIRAIAMEAM